MTEKHDWMENNQKHVESREKLRVKISCHFVADSKIRAFGLLIEFHDAPILFSLNQIVPGSTQKLREGNSTKCNSNCLHH